MKGMFARRLRENFLDVADWIDYRPDPHWWQYAAVPLVASGLFLLPPSVIVVLGIFAAAATAFAAGVFLVGLGLYVASCSLADVIQSQARNLPRPAPPRVQARAR